MIEDILGGLLEGLFGGLFEVVGEALGELCGAILEGLFEGAGDFLSEAHGRHKDADVRLSEIDWNGGPVERYRFLPEDADG